MKVPTWPLAGILISCLLSLGAVTPQTQLIGITVLPERIYIEQRSSQHLNFDFLVSNPSSSLFSLERITVSVFDRRGNLVHQQYAAGNGAVNVVLMPDAVLAPKTARLLFNPFTVFDSGIELARLRYDFAFSTKDTSEPVLISTEVQPRRFIPKTKLILPLRGRLLVPNGSDFYSHHRRMDYTDPIASQVGFNSNFMRYALDFVKIDGLGKDHKTTGKANEDFYGFATPILAPGDGLVVATHNEQRDNDIIGQENYMDASKIPLDPMSIYGNYVVIDHRNGEFSVLGHLQRGSVKVKKGDGIRRGQVMAAMGSSGTSTHPHLHYELRTGMGLAVEGLPTYFHDYFRLLGDEKMFVRLGQVNSGDIVCSR